MSQGTKRMESVCSPRENTEELDAALRTCLALAKLAPRCDHCPSPTSLDRSPDSLLVLIDLIPILGKKWLRAEQQRIIDTIDRLETELVTRYGLNATHVIVSPWDYMVLTDRRSCYDVPMLYAVPAPQRKDADEVRIEGLRVRLWDQNMISVRFQEE